MHFLSPAQLHKVLMFMEKSFHLSRLKGRSGGCEKEHFPLPSHFYPMVWQGSLRTDSTWGCAPRLQPLQQEPQVGGKTQTVPLTSWPHGISTHPSLLSPAKFTAGNTFTFRINTTHLGDPGIYWILLPQHSYVGVRWLWGCLLHSLWGGFPPSCAVIPPPLPAPWPQATTAACGGYRGAELMVLWPQVGRRGAAQGWARKVEW